MKRQLGFAGERYIYLPLNIIEQAASHPMTCGLYIKYLGHFINAKYHYIERPKGSPDHIFIYCRTGRGWVELNGVKHTIEENTFIIIPPNTPHRYGADDKEPWSIYWLHFKGSNAEYMSREYYTPSQIVVSPNSRIEERLEIFEEIYQILSIDHSVDYFCYANSCFIHFLSTLKYLEVYRQIKQQRHHSAHIESHQQINRLTHYMSENIDGKLSMDDLVNFVNLSPSYLHRLFILHFRVSPMSYFAKLKMNKACDMLVNTNMKINQIAAKLSYSDSLYFSRLFKKIVGVNPKTFRNRMLEEVTSQNP